MELRNFQPSDGGPEDIHTLTERARVTSADAIESIGLGFAYPVPKEIREMKGDARVRVDEHGSENIPVQELLKTTLQAIKSAWKNAIQPAIGTIRNTKTAKHEYKQGFDFFTIADVASEKIIKTIFNETFGEESIQIFGEEENAYTGNIESHISVRIDPIDGTLAFKDGKPNWGIMVGVYEGKIGTERQVIGAVLFPEIHALMYSIEGYGIFICDLDSGETQEIRAVEAQDDLKGLLVSFYKHHEETERGDNDAIHALLDSEGVHLRTADSTCADVLAATLNKGRFLMLYDGGLKPVDFIPYAGLERIGYKIYGWDGTEYHADDPNLDNKKIIVIPPGAAGLRLLDIVKSVSSSPA